MHSTLLALDGNDTRKLPLSERKATLGKLLRKAKPGIRYSEHLTGDGHWFKTKPASWRQEGIVSKSSTQPTSCQVDLLDKTRSPLHIRIARQVAALRFAGRRATGNSYQAARL